MATTAKEAIEMLKAAYNEQVQVCAEVLKYLFPYIHVHVYKYIYSTAHAELKRERRVRALLLASFNV